MITVALLRITTTQYKNMLDAIVTIGKAEGRPSLYRGMAATIAGAAPYTGLKFMVYESLKEMGAC